MLDPEAIADVVDAIELIEAGYPHDAARLLDAVLQRESFGS